MTTSLTSDDVYYVDAMREILSGEPCHGVATAPTRLLQHVYIGSQSNAEDLRALRRLGVTHVLNCAGYKGPRPTPDASPYEGLGIDYYEFQAEDSDRYDISRHFAESFRYLDGVKRAGGTALVHCALGINRSAAVCVAYMMVDGRLPLLAATRLIKDRRRIVLANRAFQRQLVRFARQRGLLDSVRWSSDGGGEGGATTDDGRRDHRQFVDGRQSVIIGGVDGVGWRSSVLPPPRDYFTAAATGSHYGRLSTSDTGEDWIRPVSSTTHRDDVVLAAAGNGSRIISSSSSADVRRRRLPSVEQLNGAARLKPGNRSATGYYDTIVVDRDGGQRRRAGGLDDVTVDGGGGFYGGSVNGSGGSGSGVIGNGYHGNGFWSMTVLSNGIPDGGKYYRSSGSAVSLPRPKREYRQGRSRSTSGID